MYVFLYLFPLIEDHVFQQGPVLQPFDVARTNKVWTKTLTFLAWRGQQISRAVLPRTAGFMQGISGSSMLSRIPRNFSERSWAFPKSSLTSRQLFQIFVKTWKIMESWKIFPVTFNNEAPNEYENQGCGQKQLDSSDWVETLEMARYGEMVRWR